MQAVKRGRKRKVRQQTGFLPFPLGGRPIKTGLHRRGLARQLAGASSACPQAWTETDLAEHPFAEERQSSRSCKDAASLAIGKLRQRRAAFYLDCAGVAALMAMFIAAAVIL